MAETPSDSIPADGRSGALDPIGRVSEILFGLIMVLSFTCSLSALEAGREDVREMLLGALGCNLAWGIIDAFFYLMSTAAERGREWAFLKKLCSGVDRETARRRLLESMPHAIAKSISPEISNEILDNLHSAGFQPGRRKLLGVSDLRAALVVFALVFLSTFPVAVPFMLVTEPWTALRISNLVALILLFSLGFQLGRYAGGRPWLWGPAMALFGTVLVSITIALGG